MILHLSTVVVRHVSSPIHFLVHGSSPLVFGIVHVFWLPVTSNGKTNQSLLVFDKKKEYIVEYHLNDS